MNEVWVDLHNGVENVGEFYQISNLGRVRSMDRWVRTRGNSLRKGRILTPSLHLTGYYVIGLTTGGKTYQRVISRLVAYSFLGQPALPDMQACHNDGDRSNNCLSNIRWDTPVGNAADKIRHGTNNVGATNGRAVLTENMVEAIVECSAVGERQIDIAKDLGINSDTVNHVLTGRTWASKTGIKLKRKHATVTEEMRQRMIELKKSGMRLQDIADTIGLSKAATFRHTSPAVMKDYQ